MTLRDWLQLLIVPLALVVIGFIFTIQQDTRQQQIEDQRAQQAQKIENQRAEADRAIQQQNAQDEALQAYLDQMNTLLLEKDLRSSEEGSEVRTLARARTLTVLGTLDSNRKTAVMQFLVEAHLADDAAGEGAPIIDLTEADLSGADLSGSPTWTDLSGADLRGADLREADLRGTFLGNADLSVANLGGAKLNGTGLVKTYLGEANLGGANLTGADLSGAFLGNAALTGANLTGADLSGTDLSDAFLGGADLTGATGVTNEELEQQAASLEGATMPDGQKYEDWRKDR